MKNYLLLFLLVFFIVSCDKENPINFDIDCSNLETSLIDENSEEMNVELDKLMQDLTPTPTSDDPIGHSENLNKLIERLASNCDNLKVSLVCYACIETLPVQSEIKIEFESGGNQIERIIDISTPEDDILKSVRMH